MRMPFGMGKPDKRSEDEDETVPEEAPGGTGGAPAADAFFVSVMQDGDSEVHRFNDPSTAQTFVEELLDKGIPEEHMTVFSGRKLGLRVSRRPVVTLFS